MEPHSNEFKALNDVMIDSMPLSSVTVTFLWVRGGEIMSLIMELALTIIWMLPLSCFVTDGQMAK